MVFNEDQVSFSDGKYQMHISTFIHEVLHALYFHPKAFEHFPPNKNGKPFLYKHSDGIAYIQGDNIVREAKRHFGCETLDKGKAVEMIINDSSTARQRV